MNTPRYTITRDRTRVTLPWKLTRTGDGPDRVSSHWTHADAVAMMDRLSRVVVPLPQALREGRAYGHTLVVMGDPAVTRRRELKARRMAARHRARPVSVVPAWEHVPARLERAVRESLEAARAEFTLAAPGGDA